MARVPCYVFKVEPSKKDPYKGIEGDTHYIASLLMPGAVRGLGLTSEAAKEDLVAKMVEVLGGDIVEAMNDEIELNV